jgi:PTH2 family peptidyl-tRNA hydrolase
MKQVIIVNQELKLPKGKLAAQVAHGAVAAFLEASEEAQQAWLDEGMPKIVLSVPVLADLLLLKQNADTAGLPNCLIEDAGRTVIPEGTITCLGLGPAEDERIDTLTGQLKLL